MIALWIPITIAAAFLQNARSALQKRAKAGLGTTGATFIRFGYGFPFALLYFAFLYWVAGLPLPTPNLTFAFYAVIGGLAQIGATALLVGLFSAQSFAVATTFSKTETVQTAIVGIVLLGEHISLGATVGILVSLAGVLALSKGALAPITESSGGSRWKPILLGLLSGGAFGLSAVSYRAASLALGGEGFLMQAAFTLACATVVQTVVMAAYMRLREPGSLTACARAWQAAVWVGLAGAAASACWFTAMTLQKAAYVRALGQIELVFTIAASVLMFGEKPSRTEVVGIVLVSGGILILLLTG